MIQESNGSLDYAPFGVRSWSLSTPFGCYLPLKVNETGDLYPLRSMKRAISIPLKVDETRAIVVGPRRNSRPAANAAKRCGHCRDEAIFSTANPDFKPCPPS